MKTVFVIGVHDYYKNELYNVFYMIFFLFHIYFAFKLHSNTKKMFTFFE